VSTQRGRSRAQQVFSLPVRVYFQDTDAGGVVYHANYVNFMERARTEWLRSFGYSNAGMMKELGVMFVVRSIKLDYLRPAQLDDALLVTAHIKELGRSRVNILQTVLREEEVLVEGEVHLVCVGAGTFKPVSVPDVIRKHWN
jgi:acyl-CoA thioester hydrolase